MNNTEPQKKNVWPWLIQTFVLTTAVLIWIGVSSLDAFWAIWEISWLLYAIGLISYIPIFKNPTSGHNVKKVVNKYIYFVSSFAWGGLPAVVVLVRCALKQEYG